MPDLIARRNELAELNRLLTEPGAQFLILYGRRRVGKTTLLRHWAQESRLPFIYWVANRFSPAIQLRDFSQILYNAAHPQAPADAEFTYPNWEMAFAQAAGLAANQRLILILDEFPYLVEAESGLPTLLQHTWDQQLKETQIFLVLSGSHIGMMVDLTRASAPLFDRFTADMHLQPLPFAATSEFLPSYAPDERLAVHAMLGGVPAYLERFDGALGLADNVKRHLFRPTGIYRLDPLYQLQDLVREPRNFQSVLHAIGGGAHTLGEIAIASGLAKQNVSTYLGRLRELHLVERRTPATLPHARRQRSHLGRWYLSDPNLRFYFRIIIPNQPALELGLLDAVWADVQDQLSGPIGKVAFEALSREWVLSQAHRRRLLFSPEDVGSHWSAGVQTSAASTECVDVVAISWRRKRILLGDCKWQTTAVDWQPIRALIEDKTPQVLSKLPDRGRDWVVYHAFFARTGFTGAAQTKGVQHGVDLVTLCQMDKALRAAAEL
jgi:AAA+ ATPase superfamily predicted ATPase